MNKMTAINNNEQIYSAYQYYKAHQYSLALKQYTSALRNQNDPWVIFSIQAVIAVIHIHRCNYTEANQLFQQLLQKVNLVDFQSALLLIKIRTGLIIINIISNQSQQAEKNLHYCLQVIEKIPSKAHVLFRSILHFLFGFDSFRDMKNLASSLQTQQGYQGNGIMYSAMAMNRQLFGCEPDLQLAYWLQYKAYQSFRRTQDYNMMIISCRHLIHLSKELNLSKNNIKKYQDQFHYLMTKCQEVSGISQITLFRNYQEKIALATKISNKLLYFENNQLSKYIYNNQSNKQQIEWKKNALINKLKRSSRSNNQNKDSVNRTLEIIEKHQQNIEQLLEAMEKSKLLEEATRQYQFSLIKIQKIVKKNYLRQFWILLLQQDRAIQQKLLNINPINQQNSSFLSNKRGTPKLQHASVLRRTQKFPKISNTNYQRQKIISFNNVDSRFNRQYEYQQRNQQKISPNQYPKKSSRVKQRDHQDLIRQIENTNASRSKSRQKENEVSNQQVLAILKKSGNKNNYNPSSTHNSNANFQNRNQYNPNQYKSQMNRNYNQRPNANLQQQFEQHDNQQNNQEKTYYQSQKFNNYSPSKVPKPNISKFNNSNSHYQMNQQRNFKFNPTKSRIQTHQVDVSYNPKHQSQYSNFTQLQKRSQKQFSNQNYKKNWKLIRGAKNLTIKPRHQQFKTWMQYYTFLKQRFIKHALKQSYIGQYAIKRHYSSDGGQEKFFQLDQTSIKWALQEKKINKGQSYHLKDVKGIVYGKISDTFTKQCNKNLQPWKCFSLVLKKRTLDIYCQQKDIQLWLPAIYSLTVGYHKINKQHPYRQWTVGRVIWKRFILKLKHEYPLKKHEKKYKNGVAYAIVQAWKSYLSKSRSKSISKSRSIDRT